MYAWEFPRIITSVAIPIQIVEHRERELNHGEMWFPIGILFYISYSSQITLKYALSAIIIIVIRIIIVSESSHANRQTFNRK